MRGPFTSARSKLARANHHLDNLKAEIGRFVDPKTYPITHEFNVNRTECRFNISITKPFPQTEWGMIVGDCIHNIRSALDHMVWEIAESFTGPCPSDTRTQFPIFDSPGEFRERAERMMERLPSDARTLIDAAQPYHRLPIQRHPLWLCRHLDNTDKHKVIPVIVSGVEHSGFSVTPFVQVLEGHFVGGPFEDGAEIGWFRFAHPVSPEVKVNPDFTVEVILPDGPPFVGIDHRLSVILNHVKWIINTFEMFPNHHDFLQMHAPT